MWLRRLTLGLTVSFVFFTALVVALEGLARWAPGLFVFFDHTRGSPEPQLHNLQTDWSFHPVYGLEFPSTDRKSIERSGGRRVRKENGFITYPSSERHEVIGRLNDQVIYRAIYTFDDHGRRVTVGAPRGHHKHGHVAFFGCSIVFGEGLNDHETLPSQFAQLFPTVPVYNLARQGGSVADAIAGVTTHINWDSMEPGPGFLVFSFYPSIHVARFLGSAMHLNHGSLVEYDHTTDEFKFAGNFDTKHPLWFWFSQWARESKFLKLIRFDWPIVNDKAIRSYVKAISDLRSYYQKKYPASGFVVYLGPSEPHEDSVIRYLEEFKIPYLNYTHMPVYKFAKKDVQIPYDHHPSAEFNRVMALQLAHDLSGPSNRKKLGLEAFPSQIRPQDHP